MMRFPYQGKIEGGNGSRKGKVMDERMVGLRLASA
jgi:hypothetical protein